MSSKHLFSTFLAAITGCVLLLTVTACSSSENASEGAYEITGDTTGAATDTVHVADTSPKILGGMKALLPHVNYPPEAKENNLAELVMVRFVVTREGRPTGFRAVKGEHQILVDAVIDALKQVEYEPGRRNGAPTNVYMVVPFTFRLTDAE